MKAEIINRGPISWGIRNTQGFTDYQKGVYSESLPGKLELTHEVSLVGWGVSEDGTEYWIGRNSWGTYWGEQGFFRIKMHEDNLGINTDCIFAIPIIDHREILEFETHRTFL
jgi:cathepsin X